MKVLTSTFFKVSSQFIHWFSWNNIFHQSFICEPSSRIFIQLIATSTLKVLVSKSSWVEVKKKLFRRNCWRNLRKIGNFFGGKKSSVLPQNVLHRTKLFPNKWRILTNNCYPSKLTHFCRYFDRGISCDPMKNRCGNVSIY